MEHVAQKIEVFEYGNLVRLMKVDEMKDEKGGKPLYHG